MIWSRQRDHHGSTAKQPAARVVDLTKTIPYAPSRVSAERKGSLAAGGNVAGNAIGEGSQATYIEKLVVGNSPTVHSTYARDLAPPPLGHIADRVALRASIEDQLLKDNSTIVFLEGAGGVGKTTLAAQMCADESIRRRYPGGIIWTSLGQDRYGAALADHIGDLCEYLTHHRPTTADPTMAAAALGEALGGRSPTLIVLDDVWVEEQIRPFLLGAPNTSRLFTTRNKGLAPKTAAIVEIGPMSEEEARATASEGLPMVGASSIDKIIQSAKGWPVLLGLMNASLKEHIKAGGPPSEVVDWILQLVEDDGPFALDSAAPNSLNRTLAKVLSTSIDFLSHFERERYLDLAIFREDVYVPSYIVLALWQSAGGLSHDESTQLWSKLSALRLVSERWAEGQPALAVHDILRSYLRQRLPADVMANRHAFLIAGIKALAIGQEWWSIPSKYKYALEHLGYHLAQADMIKELATLATDLRWVEKQIVCLGSVAPTVATLREVETESASLLASILENDAHVYSADNSVGATLISRLLCIEGVEALARARVQTLPKPNLQAMWPVPDVSTNHSTGHMGPIGDCAISPDGTMLATASDDRQVIIWDFETRTVRHLLRGHRQRARACSFSPDGNYLLSASMDGTLRVWSVLDGALLQTLGNSSNRILGCSWSRDGLRVAAVADDGQVSVWNAATGKAVFSVYSDSKYEWDCCFSPDQEILTTCGEDGIVRQWNSTTGDFAGEIAVHSDRIRWCTYDPAGRLIATASSDGTVKLVEAHSGSVLRTLETHTDRVRACTFSHDGMYLVSVSEDRRVCLWEVVSGKLIHTFVGHTDWVGGCAFQVDDSRLVTCSGDGTLRIWDMSALVLEAVVEAPRDAVGCVSFTSDGSRFVAGGRDGKLSVFDLENPTPTMSIDAHSGRVLCCVAHVEGVLSGGSDGNVHLWDPRTMALKRSFTRHSGRVWGVAIAAMGNLVASAGEDGRIMVHELDSTDLVHVLHSHNGHVLNCAFAPDRAILGSVGDDGIFRIWDGSSGALIRELSAGADTKVWVCDFSPDGKFAVTAGEPSGYAALWNMRDYSLVSLIKIGQGRTTGCSFSPDGRFIAGCDDDAFLGVWEVQTGRQICGIRAGYPLQKCCWTIKGGQLILVAGGAGGVYVFKLEFGE
ncbi:NB-ARC domain-containing protein [Nocardia sp. XZ_19_385]|uniref:NB-ARC domain-containing protein n=1 Tax=Nocardia sp. XZ_19_385 TaxID=2769488 RepID=UPI00188EC4E6|nr:NB-ARC domain-containing protein [Nocardia sp. XZ_19_385]